MHPDHRQHIELGVGVHRFTAVLHTVELFIGVYYLGDEGTEDVFDRIASVHGGN